ncbi:hypothetical protein [Paenibacillus sp. USDA918EY]|uniref:Uncharacterized protein n=1 Tax=Paenibacillus albilobatus TaxID=2716884 RepID=A0A919XHP8_9BACL|nr:hypothetical protein [Paenibacillus sp. USDA918EY]GIO31934.1 hypothetical protein J2TS6_30750 [Paenibacillus albilobatus]
MDQTVEPDAGGGSKAVCDFMRMATAQVEHFAALKIEMQLQTTEK